ncbi:VOC family protein [Zhouia sp. PK063]|uniref:VOC family protein n=1 Tax=Zhouia sp. PK063 TaxID=3373602 RepID=UPI0037960C8A
MIITKHIFCSFSTDNIEAAIVFYEEKLGLNTHKNEMGVLEVEISAHQYVMIYPKPNHVPATFTVLNFMVDDIYSAVNQLRKRQICFERYDHPIKTDKDGVFDNKEGHKIAWFKDNAQNILSVIQHD